MMSKDTEVEMDVCLSSDHAEIVSRQASQIIGHSQQQFGRQVAAANALAWIYGMTRWVANELGTDTAAAFLDAAREKIADLAMAERHIHGEPLH